MADKSDGKIQTERIMALLRRERPDRVPLWPFFDMTGFAAVYHNRPIADAYRDPRTSLEMQRKVCEDFGWICSPFFPAFGVTDFGGKVKLPDSDFSQAPSTTRFPIEREEDIDRIEMPDISASKGIMREKEFYSLVVGEEFDNEPFKIFLHLPSNPFDMAGRLCRPEILSRWLIKNPELAHRIIRFSQDILDEVMDYWFHAFGSENILVMSAGVLCSNQIISPKHFERYVLPYIKESHGRILAKGYERFYCHICGEHNMNMPFWRHVPMGDPGIVSIGHEVEIATAAEHFPTDIILGNIEPSIMQTGTPEEVYNATREVVEKGKAIPGGFIFSMGCQFPPRAKLENVEAMNRAVYDFGKY